MDRVRSNGPLFLALVLLAVAPDTPAPAAPLMFVANHGDDRLSIIDTATNHVIGGVAVGHAPLGVAVDPEGTHVYVSNQDGGSLSVITTANKSVVNVPVGNDPTGVAVKLPGDRVYVANRVDRSVSVIDTATNRVIATVPVEHNPLGVAVNPAGTPVYVVNKGSDSLTVIDTNTNQVVTTVAVGGDPTHVAVSPAGDRLYVTDNRGAKVTIVNATTLTVSGIIPVDGFPQGVAFSPDGTRAYVVNSKPATLSVIDTALQAVRTTITVGENAGDVSVRPDGRRVYVLNRGEKTISVIDSATDQEIDVDGNAANGITRIPLGISPVALGDAFAPAPQPPRLGKAALACQTTIAAQARTYAKADQGQQTSCRGRVLQDLAEGNGSQQTEAICASALNIGDPRSMLARARASARDKIMKRCVGLQPRDLNGPCDREGGSFDTVISCILTQHADRVDQMVADTFAAGSPKALTKRALACQTTIAIAATKFAQSEQAQLGDCLVRILKDAAKGKSIAVSAGACVKTLDPNDARAALPKLRAALEAKIAKKCVGLAPADLGNPCDPSVTTVDQLATCALRRQAQQVEKMLAAEFNDACPMLTTVGLGRAYPDVCAGH